MNDIRVPDVSVVVGAYEAMPYLVRCLESVENQTLGARRIEIVAVDDGSTDGTGEYLEKFAAKSAVPTRVVRQANSGGPSGPRNLGLSMARGRYVFFLDADDYLGEEALERMVAMGDRAGTDVVVGKVEGVNRGAPRSMWVRNEERVDLFTSRVIYTLSAQKLFRRDLLSRLDLKFDVGLKTGEDALFTMEAFLRGAGISVVADYTCYYLVGREDGKHVTKRGGYLLRFDSARTLMELISRLVPAGPKRDRLMMRPFTVTLLKQFGVGLLRQSEKVQHRKMELAAPLLAEHWTPGLAKRLRVSDRLRLECIAMGRLDLLLDVLTFIKKDTAPEVVRKGRAGTTYLAFPHFRDERAGITDAAYRVTVPDWSGSRKVQPTRTLSRRVVHRLRTQVRALAPKK
ncbi:glycosyltransferase family 2 protein [Streptomyces sp. NBC_01506]|uniref:glycosyltransferase family 2 protein n=1 Tax=Streptomyces sp. NBC_01506 TaxID=2903887 RepID=UPI00386D6666